MSTHQRSKFEPVRNRQRDVRLDFFRGLGMFIIFVAHTPYNAWADYIPARFGFSDATEIFVFCSGMASAIAFGRIFDERGFVPGVSRVAHRCWQVYWAHIGVFFVSAAVLVAADQLLKTGGTIAGQSSLGAIFGPDAPAHILGVMTLTFVPGLFNILPMYLVILAMLPLVMLASRHSTAAAFAFVILVWCVGTTGVLAFPAAPGKADVWFFNPLAWQLVFFAGFAFMRGWIPAPPIDRRLIAAAVFVIVVLVPFAFVPFVDNFAVFKQGNEALWPVIDKTNFRPGRMLHFLSVAYLAYIAAGECGRRLRGPLVAVCVKVGQQALAVFMAGVVLSQIGGIFLDVVGRNPLTTTATNLIGFAGLVATAYVTAYFKASPWQAAKHVQGNPLPSHSDVDSRGPSRDTAVVGDGSQRPAMTP